MLGNFAQDRLRKSLVSAIVIVAVAACSGNATRTVGVKGFGLNSVALLTTLEHMRATNVILAYTMPGTDITSRGGPWPYYSGNYDFDHLTGSLTIPNANSYRLPTPVSWTYNKVGSTLITTTPQPFTNYPPAKSFQDQHSIPNSYNYHKPIYRETVLFSKINSAGILDPVETYQAVVSSPAFWINLLGGVSKVLSSSNQTAANGTQDRIYNVIFNLNELRNERNKNTNYIKPAMKWLASYLGTQTLAGQLTITSTGTPSKISIIRSSRIPKNALSFPNPTQHPTLALQISKRVDTPSVPTNASTSSVSSILGGSTHSSQRHCLRAGQSGLSAAVVAHSGEHIGGSIDASGCDVGIYIPEGTSRVLVSNAQIIGATTHAILAINSADITITHNFISDTFANAIDLTLIPETKAIMLAGTSHSTVTANIGVPTIGIVDNGNVNSTAINPGTPAPASNDYVGNNQMSSSLPADCVILIASFNPGEGVTNNTISENQLSGSIVIATDAANTGASNNIVENNRLVGALLPGIIVHLNSTKDVADATIIRANTLSRDSSYPECGLTASAGIAIIGAGEPAESTVIEDNVISQEQVGIWLAGAERTTLSGNQYALPASASNFNPLCVLR